MPLKNEPVAFRGVQWGTQLDSLEDFKVVSEEGDFTTCIRKDENTRFGKAELDFIEYKFFKGPFLPRGTELFRTLEL